LLRRVGTAAVLSFGGKAVGRLSYVFDGAVEEALDLGPDVELGHLGAEHIFIASQFD
jgi:hypothetical protein